MDALSHYFDIARSAAGFSTRESFGYYVEHLFQGAPLAGKWVLDIGGGSGVYSFYAAAAGAAGVVCLEPIAEGAPEDIGSGFRRLQERLPALHNVRLERATIQSFDPAGRTFDVIVLHASINHLDEEACVKLLDDEAARESYRAIFRKIAAMSSPGARLIAVDCSRYNFFAHLGMRSPFSPDIDWRKHQSPFLWARLLADAGFENPRVSWNNRRMGGAPVRWLLGNRVASYLQSSYFCLRMERPLSPREHAHA